MAEEKSLEEMLKDAQERIKELEELTGKQKSAIDNACKDAADRKKDALEWQEKYKATLSEQEKKELEAKQREEQMLAELNGLKAEKRVATYTSKLMECGYDSTTASSMAQALPDGVNDDFFANQKSFLETKTQEIKTQTLNTQPGLSNGTPPAATDDAEIAKLRKYMGL